MYSRLIVCCNYKNEIIFSIYINTQLSVGGVASPGGNPSMLIGSCCKMIMYHINVIMQLPWYLLVQEEVDHTAVTIVGVATSI